MNISCRIFVAAADELEARSRVGVFSQAVEAATKNLAWQAYPPEPYWKIEGTYKAAFRAELPAAAKPQAFARALAESLATGWEWLPNGTTGICAANKDGRISVPHVTWIELDLD